MKQMWQFACASKEEIQTPVTYPKIAVLYQSPSHPIISIWQNNVPEREIECFAKHCWTILGFGWDGSGWVGWVKVGRPRRGPEEGPKQDLGGGEGQGGPRFSLVRAVTEATCVRLQLQTGKIHYLISSTFLGRFFGTLFWDKFWVHSFWETFCSCSYKQATSNDTCIKFGQNHDERRRVSRIFWEMSFGMRRGQLHGFFNHFETN